MPEPSCACGCANTFDEGHARDDLERYRRHGPDGTTRALIDAIAAEGVAGARLLDIGGGIGAIQLELLRAGAASAEGVDASAAYLEVARSEAARSGYEGRMTGRVGDFVAIGPEVPPADVVTLDRVVCCYSDVTALVREVGHHADRMVGLVHPRDAWWVRWFGRVADVVDRVLRRDERWYIHRQADIDDPLLAAGLMRRVVARTVIWQVSLYVRDDGVRSGG